MAQTLSLVDSTVSSNKPVGPAAALLLFNTTTTILRSTISGNVSNDVGGGIRSLGKRHDAPTARSAATSRPAGTVGRSSPDGNITIVNSTIANNIAPDYAPSAIFIGQFGGSFVPMLTHQHDHRGQPLVRLREFASGH